MLMILLGTGVSCTVRVIPDYDEVLDIGIGVLTYKIEELFERMSSDPQPSYSDLEDKYIQIFAELEALRIRAEVQARNSGTADQLRFLGNSLDEFKKFHIKRRRISSAAVKAARKIIKIHLQQMIKIELSKKEDG